MDTSTAGQSPHAWPTIGADSSTSKKYRENPPLEVTRNYTIRTSLTMLPPVNKMKKTLRTTHRLWQTQERSHPQPDTSTGYHSLVLIADPDFNALILEKLQIPPEDPSENPAKLFTAMELSHLSSHLAITASELARSAQPAEFADISDISD